MTESHTKMNFKDNLKETYKNNNKGDFSYFDFLKRNDLVVGELGIKEYQQLFPIPSKEVSYNPNVIQNPGY